MIFIDYLKNTFIKIAIIATILIIVIYNFFISKNDYTEINSLESVIEISPENNLEIEELTKIKVYVAGEVNNPGVLELNKNSRIDDAINLAGGITPSADLKNINLALVLEDGQKIYIPNINDNDTIEEMITENSSKNSKININTANTEQLQTLPGVGPSLAEKIFNYRKENGNFKTIEDLKNVNGIGEKKFESLKEYITN